MGPCVRRGDSYLRDDSLLIPRIEIFARAGGRGGVVGAGAVRPAAPARKAFAAAIAFETGSAVHLRLRAGDEGGQAIDAGIGNHRLRLGLRLILRLRTMFALFTMVLARLLIAVALEGLTLARLEIALLIVFARHERLLLRLRHEAGLLAEIGEALALVLAVVGGRHFVF